VETSSHSKLQRACPPEAVVAVIPAYNAAETIAEVVERLAVIIPRTQIVVVNDGSTDATADILNNLGVNTIHHKVNRGKGAALRSGFDWARQNGAEYILALDADTQHQPEDACTLFQKMHESRLDLIIGNRMADTRTMPWHRMLSNKITSKLISWRIAQPIPDSQSGFRLFRTKMLENLNLTTHHYDFESELLIECGRAGFQIGSCTVSTVYNRDAASSVKTIDIWRFIAIYVRSFFRTPSPNKDGYCGTDHQ